MSCLAVTFIEPSIGFQTRVIKRLVPWLLITRNRFIQAVYRSTTRIWTGIHPSLNLCSFRLDSPLVNVSLSFIISISRSILLSIERLSAILWILSLVLLVTACWLLNTRLPTERYRIINQATIGKRMTVYKRSISCNEKDMWMWIKNRSRGTNRRSVILFVISFVITIVVRRQIRAYDWMQRLSRSRDAFERIHCLIHIILRFVKLIDRLH